MGKQLFANDVRSDLVNDIDAVQTTLEIQAADAAKFPAIAAGSGNWFIGLLVDNNNNQEIVKVVNRAGAVLTIERGQEGTTAHAYLVADKATLYLPATKGTFEQIQTDFEGLTTQQNNFETTMNTSFTAFQNSINNQIAVIEVAAEKWDGSTKYVSTADPLDTIGVDGDFFFKREP